MKVCYNRQSAYLFQCHVKNKDKAYKKDYLGYGPSTAILTDQVDESDQKLHHITRIHHP